MLVEDHLLHDSTLWAEKYEANKMRASLMYWWYHSEKYLVKASPFWVNLFIIIIFSRATFVQDYDTYWVGVHSKTLSPRNSEAVNDSSSVIDSTNSEIANNSITSVISEISADPDTAYESDGDNDFRPVFADSEEENESEEDSETTRNPKRGNDTAESRRKVRIEH